MTTRLPASQRTREELSALIEGRLRTASAKDELVKLATSWRKRWRARPATRSVGTTTSMVRSPHGTAEDGAGADAQLSDCVVR
jgi:hypothetical protein